jgi:hypothetical protein
LEAWRNDSCSGAAFWAAAAVSADFFISPVRKPIGAFGPVLAGMGLGGGADDDEDEDEEEDDDEVCAGGLASLLLLSTAAFCWALMVLNGFRIKMNEQS